jgi:ferredoxin-NADP reductase
MLKYRIIDIREAGDGIKVFKMEPESGKPGTGNRKLQHKAGVFVMMHLLDEKGESIIKRPYSIASAPGADSLEFCIKMVGGEFTSKLDKLETGNMVGIEGPMGHFTYEGEKCVFICGGTGIAPIVSMARDIANQKKEGKYFVFRSARKRSMLVYFDELKEMEKLNPNIQVVFTLTREEPKDWEGKCGRIGEVLLREYVTTPEEYNWYLCGPIKMTLALKECILGMGVDEKKVHFEGWG